MPSATTASVKSAKDKPTAKEKEDASAKLVAKGVSLEVAKDLSGEKDNKLTRQEIAAKRIAWQRGLPKAKPRD